MMIDRRAFFGQWIDDFGIAVRLSPKPKLTDRVVITLVMFFLFFIASSLLNRFGP